MIFFAFDGVAPRAKMNQQRQRRFQSATKYSKTLDLLYNLNQGKTNDAFTNNQISVGTAFMAQLNKKLMFFIKRKMFEDKKWKGLKIVFSGSDVPGEGEHKILHFINKMKGNKQFIS